MRKKNILYTLFFVITICFSTNVLSTKVFAETEDDVITKGVYIDSIHIGGMTASEALRAVNDYVEDLKQKQLTIHIDTNTETLTLGELGFDYVKNDYIEQAVGLGKTGNLIKRYKELKDIEKVNLVYNLEYTVNDTTIKEFVESFTSKYDIPAVDATITRENGEFKYTDHVVGRSVQVDETIQTIKSAIQDNWNGQDLELTASVDDAKPKYTREMVEKCNTVLGTFSTTYTTSSADRAGNLANGAKLINNTVLYPGDVFSAYEKLTPFTIENGYFQAGAYANGKVVDSIGGGACQVTTTLYNAVLFSELEIVERASHSMTIGYVDLSRDAAIAGTWKDLKFKNNTDAPILVEATTKGRTITFKIWGHETRDTSGRKVEFETVVLSETAPGADVVTEDETKPTTYQVTTQSAHTGYVAELYKIVYENGVEVSRTRINKSIYNASPRYVTVGTKEEEPEKVEDDKAKDGKAKDDKIKDEIEEENQDDIQGDNTDNGDQANIDENEDSVETIDQNQSNEEIDVLEPEEETLDPEVVDGGF